MIGLAGCFITQLPQSPVGTTFTFKGKFADANAKQTFQINHPDGSSTPFEFKRIKSLFYSTTCAQVTNQAAKTVPRCEIVNIPITVANVQWGTNFESPSLCFGSITDFEYQIPNGWSIGANVSTGNNWISGGNNVTVTSNLSNGVNGVILIRPRNICAAGLQNGQTPGQIPINRPAPSLTMSQTEPTICSGSKSFSLTGLPSGATTSWSITNTYSVASLSNSTNASAQVNKINSNNGKEVLKATVTHCSFTYTVEKELFFGIQTPTFIDYSIDPYVKCNEVRVETDYFPSTSYTWSYFKQPYSGNNVVFPNSGSTKKLTITQGSGTYNIGVTATNSCGTSNIYFITVPLECDDEGGGHRFAVSPNPATDFITIKKRDKTTSEIKGIKIFDNSGNLKKQEKYNIKAREVKINVADLKNGIYLIEILTERGPERQQIIIQK